MGQGTLTMRGKRGLGDDGSEGIKRHSWFKGVDWESKSPISNCSSHQTGWNPNDWVIGNEDRRPPPLSDCILVPKPYIREEFD
jgi:hypothetical protein